MSVSFAAAFRSLLRRKPTEPIDDFHIVGPDDLELFRPPLAALSIPEYHRLSQNSELSPTPTAAELAQIAAAFPLPPSYIPTATRESISSSDSTLLLRIRTKAKDLIRIASRRHKHI